MEFLAFYRLNNWEKESMKEESPLEKEVKLLKQRIEIFEKKIMLIESEKFQQKTENKSKSSQLYHVGEEIKFGNYDWIVLDADEEKVFILCKKCVKKLSYVEFKYDNWLKNIFLYTFSISDQKKIIINFSILTRKEAEKYKSFFKYLSKEDWALRKSKTDEKDFCIVNKYGNILIVNYNSVCGIRPAVYIKNKN